MARVMLISGSTRVLVPSFVDGGRVVSVRPRRETEAGVMARALWLERRGREEEAVEYLEGYLHRASMTPH